MNKQEKFHSISDKILVRQVRVAKTLISEKTGNSHTVEFVADVEESSISEASVVCHILGMKAESCAYLQLVKSEGYDEDEPNKVREKMEDIKKSYSILISQELENL